MPDKNDSWSFGDENWAWFILIPRRWWSLKAWKLMWDLKCKFLYDLLYISSCKSAVVNKNEGNKHA